MEVPVSRRPRYRGPNDGTSCMDGNALVEDDSDDQHSDHDE